MMRFISRADRTRRINVLLKRKGWSWYQLGKEMNMADTTVRRAFLNIPPQVATEPSLKTLKSLARALNVSAGFFIDKEIR
jgi:transcriptional regulator with XRE-family HTH domain